MKNITATILVVMYGTSILAWGLFGLLPIGWTPIKSQEVGENWLAFGLLLFVIALIKYTIKGIRNLFSNIADKNKQRDLAQFERTANIPPRRT